MRIKFLFAMFVLAAFVMLKAQTYPIYTVKEIQAVNLDSLARGNDASPHKGDTVRVLGVCMVRSVVDPDTSRKVIMWAGTRWQSYLCDTSYSSNEWAGLNIIQDDTVNTASLLDRLDTASIYTITGVVAEYGKQTQLNVLKTVPVQKRGAKPARRQPVEVSLTDFSTSGTPNLIGGEKYEGMYVIFRNVLTTDRTTSTSAANPFAIHDGNGNKIAVHGQSGYFTKRAYYPPATGGLRAWDPPADGSVITYIRGVMGQNTDGSWVIRPMYPDDIQLGMAAPVASSLKRDVMQAAPNQAVNITAKIVDLNTGGTVDSARIYYHVNGGQLKFSVMTKSNDTTWTGQIPGQAGDSNLVDYFVWAKNNAGLSGMSPADTARNRWFYYSMTRTQLRIQDIMYSPFGGGYSAYNNWRVTVSGVVTADIYDLEGDGGSIPKRAHIQNGSGPWSGIQLNGAYMDSVRHGQNVTVTGTVNRANLNNRLDTIVVVVNSSNNPDPAPLLVGTREIATVASGTVSAQKYESVLIKYTNVVVTKENADGNPGPSGTGNSNYGEMMIADTSNVGTRCELQEGNHKYHNFWTIGMDTVSTMQRIKNGDKFSELRGIVYYSFSNYKIVPRTNADFIGYVSDVKRLDNVKLDGYSVSQNYPNPFNPVTAIHYSIPEAGKVTLKVYNMLGQEVRTLVDHDQNAGTYKVYFDASSMASGIYFYKIQSGKFSEVRKMTLIK